MKPSMRARLEQLANRIEDIDAILSEPETGQDMKRFRALSRERAELEPVATAFKSFMRTEDEYQQAKDLMSDPDMKEMAGQEMQQCKERIETLADELQVLLLPKDPDDTRSVFLEIRAGTGGDESALFCGDLLRMYTRYAERKGWRVELMSESAAEVGGYKEVIVRIDGEESGANATAGDLVHVLKVMTDGYAESVTGEEAFRYTVTMLPQGDYAVRTCVAGGTASAVVVSPSTLASAAADIDAVTATLGGRSYTNGLTWSSSDNAIATVSPAGIVTSIATGTATITATAGNGQTGTCAVTVS